MRGVFLDISTSRPQKDHHYSHTKEKCFTCSVCGRGFTERTILRKHMIISHLKRANQKNIKRVQRQQTKKRSSPSPTFQLSTSLARCGADFMGVETSLQEMAPSTLSAPLSSRAGRRFEYELRLENMTEVSCELPGGGITDGNGNSAPSAKVSSSASRVTLPAKPWSLSTSVRAPRGLGNKCVVCGETKENWSSLWAHLNTHNPVPPDPEYFHKSTENGRLVECLVCGKQMGALYHLRRHYSSHVTKRVFQCPACSSSTKTATSFIHHFSRAHGENAAAEYGCSQCGRTFRSVQGLRQHKLEHTGGDGKERCEVCFKRVRSQQLRSHYFLHTKETCFACTVCGRGYVQRARLRRHIRVSHLHIKPRRTTRECKVCGMVVRNSNFESHMRRHTGEPSDICCVCGRPFYNRKHYVSHMARIHIGVKDVACPVCGKKFYAMLDVQQHVNVHVQEKKFKCDICGKGFAWKHKIGDHMRTHSEERPFKCDRCGKAFKWKHNLAFHAKRIHSK